MKPDHVEATLEYLRDEWRESLIEGSVGAIERGLRSLETSIQNGRLVVPRDTGGNDAIESVWGFYVDPRQPLKFAVPPHSGRMREGDIIDVFGKFAWAAADDGDVKAGDLRLANMVTRLWTGTQGQDGDFDPTAVRDAEMDEWTTPEGPPAPNRRVIVKWHFDFAPEHPTEPCYHATFGGAAREGERALYQHEIPRVPRIPITPFDFTLGLEIVASNFLGDDYRDGKRRDALWRTALNRSETDLLEPYLRISTRRLQDDKTQSHYELWEGILPI